MIKGLQSRVRASSENVSGDFRALTLIRLLRKKHRNGLVYLCHVWELPITLNILRIAPTYELL